MVMYNTPWERGAVAIVSTSPGTSLLTKSPQAWNEHASPAPEAGLAIGAFVAEKPILGVECGRQDVDGSSAYANAEQGPARK